MNCVENVITSFSCFPGPNCVSCPESIRLQEIPLVDFGRDLPDGGRGCAVGCDACAWCGTGGRGPREMFTGPPPLTPPPKNVCDVECRGGRRGTSLIGRTGTPTLADSTFGRPGGTAGGMEWEDEEELTSSSSSSLHVQHNFKKIKSIRKVCIK